MPPDDQLTDELISRYDEAWRVLARQPHPDGLHLLLNSFGKGSGFGVYQLVPDAVRTYAEEAVVVELAAALRSPHGGVRSWASEIAPEYRDSRLTPAVLDNLEGDDDDVRVFAAQFLAEVGQLDAEQLSRIQDVLALEMDDEIRQDLRRALRQQPTIK